MISPVKSNFGDPKNGGFHKEMCKSVNGFINSKNSLEM